MNAPAPQFKVGDILRYGSGSTALMRVSYISPMHGSQPRYYGQQCMGGSCGAYQSDCRPASTEDIATWEKCGEPQGKWQRTPWDHFFGRTLASSSAIVGVVED